LLRRDPRSVPTKQIRRFQRLKKTNIRECQHAAPLCVPGYKRAQFSAAVLKKQVLEHRGEESMRSIVTRLMAIALLVRLG